MPSIAFKYNCRFCSVGVIILFCSAWEQVQPFMLAADHQTGEAKAILNVVGDEAPTFADSALAL